METISDVKTFRNLTTSDVTISVEGWLQIRCDRCDTRRTCTRHYGGGVSKVLVDGDDRSGIVSLATEWRVYEEGWQDTKNEKALVCPDCVASLSGDDNNVIVCPKCGHTELWRHADINHDWWFNDSEMAAKNNNWVDANKVPFACAKCATEAGLWNNGLEQITVSDIQVNLRSHANPNTECWVYSLNCEQCGTQAIHVDDHIDKNLLEEVTGTGIRDGWLAEVDPEGGPHGVLCPHHVDLRTSVSKTEKCVTQK